MRRPRQETFFSGARVLVWFSCGAASACAAKLAIERYGERAQVIYCDTLKYEHSDNRRFMSDVEQWIGQEIKVIRSDDYTDIFDVFDKTGWLVGVGGARCTAELKRNPRQLYQRVGDYHVFGYTLDEAKRIIRFEKNNPELYLWWPLVEYGMTKQRCLDMLNQAGIELPVMYRLGYKNNNCIGCVKGKAGYWNKIRRDFPEAFARMAAQERKMNVRILHCFLDELPADAGNYYSEYELECGPACVLTPLAPDRAGSESGDDSGDTRAAGEVNR